MPAFFAPTNNREMSIEEIVKQPSILAVVINSPEELKAVSDSSELRLEFVRRLEALGIGVAKSRAVFILNQDISNFNANRVAWGVPNFSEELVGIDDFKNGFLWRFRAHTTSWGHNQRADEWFYTSLEARTITRYEFWDCDEGPEKVDFVLTGDCKAILKQLLSERIYEVLISPVFSKEELAEYINNFSEDQEAYSLEEIIEDYISCNPNFSIQ